MSFNFSNMNKGAAKGTSVTHGARVSAKTLAQVEKTGDLRQAGIILTGKLEAGTMTFKVDGVEYTAMKGKDNMLWPGHQGAHMESFQKLFNRLAKKPDEMLAMTDVVVTVAAPEAPAAE